jgi:site-specific DNA-methyltransferase (adenine-specific)
VSTHFKDWPVSTTTRPLLEEGADVFIRFNEGLSILKKIAAIENTGKGKRSLSLPETKRFDHLVSSLRPFGLRTYFKGKTRKSSGDVLVYQNGGQGYAPRKSISTGVNLIDAWKVYVGRAAPGTGNKDTYPHRIISTPFLGEPGSISSETYLCIGPLASKSEAESVLSYLCCRLTRFLILLHKPSADTTRKVYAFVPTQKWAKPWSDAGLYKRYGLAASEIEFIEGIVRPMEINDELFDELPGDEVEDE